MKRNQMALLLSILMLAASALPALAEGPLEPYAEPVTVTTVRTAVTAVKYPEGDDETVNAWTRLYEEELNIKVDSLWVSSEYETKLNMSIASGQLPDAFHVSMSQLRQLVEADMLYDMMPVYEAYASEETRRRMDAFADGFQAGVFDGKLYGLSHQHFGIIDKPDYVWIRNDWMERLGFDPPETIEDLLEIARAFTFGDPDGNGVDDTYGLAAQSNLQNITMLFPSFHAYPDIWIRNGAGEIVYGNVQPEVKDALAFFRDLYAEGILHKEFAAMNNDKMTEEMASGKVGIVVSGQWFAAGPAIVDSQGAEAIFYPYQLPTGDGEPVFQCIPWPVSSYTAVSAGCKNPEAVIKLINMYGHIRMNGTAEEYEIYVNNSLHSLPKPFLVEDADSNYMQYVNISKAQPARDMSFLTNATEVMKYNNIFKWLDNGDATVVSSYLQISDKGSYAVAKEILDNGWIIMDEMRGITPQILVDRGSTMTELLNEGYTKIIMGQEPVDYFDTLVANWEKAGGTSITAEMNALYP